MEQFLPADEVLLTVKPKSRELYRKCWLAFMQFSEKSAEFDERMPSELEFIAYFNHLRLECKRALSSLWTTYSMLNTVVKGKYNKNLQSYHRFTRLVKSFDVDNKRKAEVFSTQDMNEFLEKDLSTPYWIVRKAVAVLAYFGGLRLTELIDLQVFRFIFISLDIRYFSF